MNEHDNDFLKVILDNMREDISAIRLDVEDIKKFRWQIIGGSVVLSILITSLFQIFSLYIKH